MASVDGGPLFEQQQQSGIVYGDTGGMDIKAANLNHLVTLVVSFFDPKPNKRLLRMLFSQSDDKRSKKSRKRPKSSFNASASTASENSYTVSADLGETATRKLMDLVKTGLTVDDTLDIMSKGSESEISEAFQWLDAKNQFPAMLFHTYHWFVPQEALVLKFIEMYQLPKKPPPHFLPNGFTSWTKEARATLKRSVCLALMFWAKRGLFRFAETRTVFEKFLVEVEADKVLSNTELETFKTLVTHPLPVVPKPLSDPEKGPLDFADPVFSAQVIAEQLTLLDWQFLCRVKDDDFRIYVKAKSGTTPECPKLLEAINHNNAVGLWVVTTLLRDQTLEGRAEILTKFVAVCKFLRQLGNFGSLMSISGAFSHAAIGRLKHTFARLPKSVAKDLAEIEALMSPNNNHDPLRAELKSASTSVPYLGLQLKDIMSIHNSYENMSESLINTQKFSVMHEVLEGFQHAKAHEPSIPAVPEVQVKLMNSIETSAKETEKDLYNLSLKREPRDSAAPAPRKVEPSKPKQRQAKTPRTLKTPTRATGRTSSKILRRRNANPHFPGNKIPGERGNNKRRSWSLGVLPAADELKELSSPETSKTAYPERFSASAIIESFAMHALPNLGDSLEAQVDQLVETLMFNFDSNKTGKLGPAEHKELKHVFTHLSSFEVMDGDGDGAISRVDLARYLYKVAGLYEVQQAEGHRFFALDDTTNLLCAFCQNGFKTNDVGMLCHLCNEVYHPVCTLLLGDCPGGRSSLVEENVRLQAQTTVLKRQVEILQQQQVDDSSPPADPGVDKLISTQKMLSNVKEEKHKELIRQHAVFVQCKAGELLQDVDDIPNHVLFSHSGEFIIWETMAHGQLGPGTVLNEATMLSKLEGLMPVPMAILTATSGSYWRMPMRVFGNIVRVFADSPANAPHSVSGSPQLIRRSSSQRLSPRRVQRRSVFELDDTADPFEALANASKSIGSPLSGDVFTSLAGTPEDPDRLSQGSLSSLGTKVTGTTLVQELFPVDARQGSQQSIGSQSSQLSVVSQGSVESRDSAIHPALRRSLEDSSSRNSSTSSLPAAILEEPSKFVRHLSEGASPRNIELVQPPKSRARREAKRRSSYHAATNVPDDEPVGRKRSSAVLSGEPELTRKELAAPAEGKLQRAQKTYYRSPQAARKRLPEVNLEKVSEIAAGDSTKGSTADASAAEPVSESVLELQDQPDTVSSENTQTDSSSAVAQVELATGEPDKAPDQDQSSTTIQHDGSDPEVKDAPDASDNDSASDDDMSDAPSSWPKVKLSDIYSSDV